MGRNTVKKGNSSNQFSNWHLHNKPTKQRNKLLYKDKYHEDPCYMKSYEKSLRGREHRDAPGDPVELIAIVAIAMTRLRMIR